MSGTLYSDMKGVKVVCGMQLWSPELKVRVGVEEHR